MKKQVRNNKMELNDIEKRDTDKLQEGENHYENKEANASQPPPNGIASTKEDQGTPVEESVEIQPNDTKDDDTILCEAAIEYTELERSGSTKRKLNCISIVTVIVAGILFAFSFPFSLFLVLFCFNTKRACQPFKYIQDSPWRLYLTPHALHYDLPNPPHRPYINLFYCLKRFYSYTIPLSDIANVSVGNREETNKGRDDPLNNAVPQNIIVDLKSISPGVDAPVSVDWLGIWTRYENTHTLAIFSVRDAATFVETVKQHLK